MAHCPLRRYVAGRPVLHVVHGRGLDCLPTRYLPSPSRFRFRSLQMSKRSSRFVCSEDRSTVCERIAVEDPYLARFGKLPSGSATALRCRFGSASDARSGSPSDLAAIASETLTEVRWHVRCSNFLCVPSDYCRELDETVRETVGDGGKRQSAPNVSVQLMR